MSHAHENNFDFLRFAAATFVWYSHCYALTNRSDGLNSLFPFESFGLIGVTMFFIISGYFITASYERHDSFCGFMRNRALRILPALVMTTLLSAFIIGPLVTALPLASYLTHSQTYRYLRTILIFPLQYELPGVFQGNPQHAVNGSLWTLQHEARCYIIIALMGILGILQTRVMLALFGTLVGIMAYGALCGDKPPESLLTVRWTKLYFAVHLGMLFTGGALVYMFRHLVPRHLGLFTGCILLAIFSMKLPDMWGQIVFDMAMIYGVIYLGFSRIPVLSHFGRFGDFSYGMYLYAFPMQQLTLYYMQGRSFSMPLFMIVSFVLTLLCAIASWHLIEKRALAYKV